jgi:hypothetical protein
MLDRFFYGCVLDSSQYTIIRTITVIDALMKGLRRIFGAMVWRGLDHAGEIKKGGS